MENNTNKFDIKDMMVESLNKKIEDGSIQKTIDKAIDNTISGVVDELFGKYGDITRIIEKKFKETMTPIVEGYNYSEYITKLDTVLTQLIKQTASPNQKILKNFQQMMLPEKTKEITLTKIFEKYCDYCSQEVDTSKLEICYEDEPHYYDIEVGANFEKKVDWEWKNGKIKFSCEQDNILNYDIKLWQSDMYKDTNKWKIFIEPDIHLDSLANVSEFEAFIWNLKRNFTTIIIDEDNFYDEEVEVQAEPEADYR